MKRRISRLITLCIAMAMLLAPSISKAYAGPAAGESYAIEYKVDDGTDEGKLVVLSPEKAKTKPVLSISRLKVPVNQLDEDIDIELMVNGAEGKYASTGLHVKFDDRLQLIPVDDEDYADYGPAAKKLSAKQELDYVDENGDPHGLFLTTSCGNGNGGKDGVLWSFKVNIPENAKVGDKYPIEVFFWVDKENSMRHDIFTNFANDKDGKNMEAWVFTKGIEQGYIEITGARPKMGDLNGDGIIDAVDASVLLANYAKYSTDKAAPTADDIEISDVNKDGKINAVDASLLLAFYARVSSGKVITFKAFCAEIKSK